MKARHSNMRRSCRTGFVHDRDGVTVRAGGDAMVNVEITEQSQRDLLLMESLAIPISFVVLVWVFGGVLAAAVPLAVGGMAILGALAVLRGVTHFADVSIFALNLSAAMGLALAIDYTLLIISRYRDELEGRRSRDDALVQTMATAGRTVVFSATIVALSMAVMVVFPMAFLKSFAYAGVATVAFAALAALFVTPGGAGSTRRSVARHWIFADLWHSDTQPAGTGRAHRRAARPLSVDENRHAARHARRIGGRRAAPAARCPVPRGEVGIPGRSGTAEDRVGPPGR